MCGGGGGGGDGGASQREAQRQAKQDAAIAQIDQLFGIERDAPAPQAASRGTKVFGVTLPAAYLGNTGNYDRKAAQANKAAREATYGKVRGDVVDYFRPELDKQKTDAERATRFSLASRGLTGGSADINQHQELQDRYLKGVLAVTNKGDAAANAMRGADSRTRLDMISRINAGADAGTALSSSMNEMNANVNSARDAAFSQNLNSFFDDMAFLQRAKSDYINNQTLQNTFSNYFNAPTGGSAAGGKVTKSG